MIIMIIMVITIILYNDHYGDDNAHHCDDDLDDGDHRLHLISLLITMKSIIMINHVGHFLLFTMVIIKMMTIYYENYADYSPC